MDSGVSSCQTVGLSNPSNRDERTDRGVEEESHIDPLVPFPISRVLDGQKLNGRRKMGTFALVGSANNAIRIAVVNNEICLLRFDPTCRPSCPIDRLGILETL